MPPISIAGRRLVVSADDFVFMVPAWMLANVIFILADTSKAIRVVFEQARFSPLWMIELDAFICVACMPVDVIVGVLSSLGAIGQQRKYPNALACAFLLRFLLSVALFIIFAILMVTSITTYGHHIYNHMHLGKDPHYLPVDADAVGGWGPELGQAGRNILLWIALTFRFVLYIMTLLWFRSITLAEDSYGAAVDMALRSSLTYMGAGTSILTQVALLISQVFDSAMLEHFTPSDLVFGLMLWKAKQGQGFVGTDPDDEYVSALRDTDTSSHEALADDEDSPVLQGVPPNVLRASMMPSHGDEPGSSPKPFRQESARDMDALREIVHLLPFALAIYGWPFELLVKSVQPGTTLPTFCSLLRALCNLPFCGSSGVDGNTLGERTAGDWCCLANERSALRVISEAAEKSGEETAELLWATWENWGPGTSPPLAVFLDSEKQQIVVTVRGTMDIKDCIADVGAVPAFFDPLSEAPPNTNRQAPFDDDRDFFVHSTMLQCAEDALECLEESGEFREALAPGGRAHGWRVVCCGHSLGAGVSCILAMLLRPTIANIHHVGFETPGGLVSPCLARIAQQLGWLVAVCANDWIPRLSVRNVENTRDKVLDAIVDCEHSKVGILMLVVSGMFRNTTCCCFSFLRRPLACLFETLAGGPLKDEEEDADVDADNKSLLRQSVVREAIARGRNRAAQKLFPKLWPAGNIVYFRPIATVKKCCGWYEHDTHWVAEWISPADLNEIIISFKSVEYHFPNILKYAYSQAASSLGAILDEDSES